MTVDWPHFTPWTSLAGGVLIGLAAALLVLGIGRIAGISGIVGGLLRPARGDVGWRLAFVLGLLVAPAAVALVHVLPDTHVAASARMLVVAGLLVGIGTRFAGGCTSGHGVCGLSRRSPRSLAAVVVFMAAGFVTVHLARHVL